MASGSVSELRVLIDINAYAQSRQTCSTYVGYVHFFVIVYTRYNCFPLGYVEVVVDVVAQDTHVCGISRICSAESQNDRNGKV